MVSSNFTSLVFCSDVACKSTKPCHIADDDQSSVDTAELARQLNATLEKRSNPASDNAVSTSAAPRNEHPNPTETSDDNAGATQRTSSDKHETDIHSGAAQCSLSTSNNASSDVGAGKGQVKTAHEAAKNNGTCSRKKPLEERSNPLSGNASSDVGAGKGQVKTARVAAKNNGTPSRKKRVSQQQEDDKLSPAACDHDDPANFEPMDNNSYFSEKCLYKTPNAPRKCCDESCSSGRFGKECKVGISRPVYCCINAKNSLHPCTHAHCKTCFLEWRKGLPSNGSSNTGGQRSK